MKTNPPILKSGTQEKCRSKSLLDFMSSKLVLLALLLQFNSKAAVTTPFIAYTTDIIGSVSTNTVTIEAWANTNTITGVSTNLVINFAKTYTPASSNGYFAGYLAPGNYRLTVDGLSRGVVFGIPSSSSTQNLAQLAGVPVYAYMNFTLAQFSDAGTAAYSNASAFFLSSLAGTAAYSNAAAFVTQAQWTNLYQSFAPAVSNLYLGAFNGDLKSGTNLQPAAFTSGTNGISETVTLLSNYVNRSQSQSISGDKTFTGTILISNLAGIFHVGTLYCTNHAGIISAFTNGVWWNGALSNALWINGNFGAVTGGVWRSGFASGLTMTNAVNYGSAFSSPGSGNASEQIGSSAVASGDGSTAFGQDAYAAAGLASAVGNSASATAQAGSAFGWGAFASGTNASAIGASTVAGYNNSTAIGYGAATTEANQTVIGSGTVKVKISGDGSVGGNFYVTGNMTNIQAVGTNSFSDVSFRRYSNASLVNGANAAVLVGTNTFVQVSGPSSAFTINGLNGSPNRDGHLVVILNKTGQNMTVAHDSGIEPTAANRIISMTGADRVTTGNGAAVLIYSASESRWQLIHLDP